jgi:meso-butanediol dehydrogenase/(S,S)-butanediol dehydrogenase/diacetyl reductase
MNKTVVVTGAGSGIGQAIAVELAERNWRVVATDRDAFLAESTYALLGGSADTHAHYAVDVTDPTATARVAEQVAERFGLDAWVNNAGISINSRFVDVTPENFDRTHAVNLRGVFFGGQAAAKVMIAAGTHGTIVNTASMAGKEGKTPYLADYVASKFGVVGLTQAMAFELAQHQITVNAICPGFVVTPLHGRELDWESKLRGISPDEIRAEWVKSTPLGRLEQPADVARAVAFLVSDDARFITGESLAVNGGAFMD